MAERVDDHGMKELHLNRPRDDKIVCEVKCTVINVGEIDTKKQQFQADIFLSFKWKEPRFDGKRLEDINDNEFWDPRVYIANAVTIDEKNRKNEARYQLTDQNGHRSLAAYAYLSLRLKGTFKIAMKLEKFPFDYQELTVKVTSSWRKENIAFQRRLTEGGKIMDNIYMDTFSEDHEWNLQEHIACTNDESVDSTGSTSTVQNTLRDSAESTTSAQEPILSKSNPTENNNTSIKGVYPMYSIKLHAQRKPSYFVWNVIVPMICILALSFTTFTIEAGAPSDRLSVTVTMLLTAVAFKSTLSSMLPRISYLTFLDYWILCNFGLQCLIVAQNAFIGASWWYDRIRNFVDLGIGIALGIVAFVLNITFIGIGRCQYIKAKKIVTEITQEYQDNRG